MNNFNPRFVIAAVVGVLLLMFGACSMKMTVIDPGHVGIKIDKLGDNKGVNKNALVQGMQFYCPFFTNIVSYPVSVQRVAWTHDVGEGHPANEEITFNTKDSVPVNIDVALSYQLDSSKAPEFYNKFRKDRIDDFTHGYMRDTARNVVAQIGSEYNFDELNGAKKEEFLQRVCKLLQDDVRDIGIGIQQFGLIGSLRPPQALADAVNAKTQAVQRALQVQNEVAQAEAEARKKVAIANGEAAANRALASSLDPKLLEWERLQIQRMQVSKWNGKLPDTMLGNGASTLLQLK